MSCVDTRYRIGGTISTQQAEELIAIITRNELNGGDGESVESINDIVVCSSGGPLSLEGMAIDGTVRALEEFCHICNLPYQKWHAADDMLDCYLYWSNSDGLELAKSDNDENKLILESDLRLVVDSYKHARPHQSLMEDFIYALEDLYADSFEPPPLTIMEEQETESEEGSGKETHSTIMALEAAIKKLTEVGDQLRAIIHS
jgi:hypothetical protein